MLSAALSRIHDLPPLVVLKRIPLPPAAQASSCMHNLAIYIYIRMVSALCSVFKINKYCKNWRGNIRMFFLFFLFFFLFLLEPVTRLLRARIGYLIKQLFAWRNSLPLNDIQHQECQNPGFEQEPPQILQLTETTINNVLIWKEMKQKSTAGKKCNKANYFLSR